MKINSNIAYKNTNFFFILNTIKKRMNNIYCGNNQLDEELVNGTAVIGNRIGCLRKGIGKGKQMAYNKKFTGPFQPISNRNLYCGNANVLPNAYANFGENFECLQKGIGIGQRQKALEGFTPILINYTLFIFIFLTLCTIVFLTIYYTKPYFILKINVNVNDEEIDFVKYILICINICILIFIIMFCICYRFYKYKFF